jgi:hypothetical protein
MTKRKSQLAPKHQLYAKNLIKHNGNKKNAYLETYPTCSVSSASTGAAQLLKAHPEIIEEVKHALNTQGVTINKLSKKLAQLLDAEKAIVVNNNVQHVNDNASQLKAVELGMKAHGVLKEVDNSTTYNVQVNQQLVLDKLGERMDKVLEMLGYNIGRDDQGNKVIHNLSTSEAQATGVENKKVVVDADYSVNDGDSSSGVEGSVED